MSDGKVVNVYHCPDGWKQDPQYVYIGRNSSFGRPDWGNPYRIGVDGKGTRNEVLSFYLCWLQQRLRGNSSMMQRIHSLHGKTLVCHCAPERCHGDFLLALSNGLHAYEVERGRKDWYDIMDVEDLNRLEHMHQLVRQVVIDHGKAVLTDLSQVAQYAAQMELGKGVEDPKVKFKEFRTKYLDPLLKWHMPTQVREPVYTGELSEGAAG